MNSLHPVFARFRAAPLFWFRLLLGCAGALCAPIVRAADVAATSGLVTGQVSNAATSVFLEGAEVSLEGGGRSVTTDREGRYELNVSGGAVSLVVRYTGLEPQRVTVEVKPGARVVR